ncbi:MAG: DUF1016 N-terminal domain-containing protein, partial [Gemmatimonadota bacterium]
MAQDLSRAYEELRAEVAGLLLAGRERARQAVEREKVRTSWEVGRLLAGHLELRGGVRGAYGQGVIRRLADDLGLDSRRLYEMMSLYRAFPKLRPTGQLSFTHYVKLIAVPQWQARAFYQKSARERGWSVRQLATAIRAGAYEREGAGAGVETGAGALTEDGSGWGDGGAEETRRAPLSPRKGRLFTYRVLEAGARYVKLDLGFRVRLGLTGEPAGLQAGDAVEVQRTADGGDPPERARAGAFAARGGAWFALAPDPASHR